MSTRILINEFAKLRHLHIWLLVLVLLVVVVGVGLTTSVVSPDFDPATGSAWNSLLGGIGSGFPLAAPLLLAVIASRHVDAEHLGGGWVLSATSGVTPGGLCRAKFMVLGLLVGTTTVLTSCVFAGAGLGLGISPPMPWARWAGFTLAVLVVNLVVLALHILLAARVENQLVGIGVGLFGTIIALFGSAVPAWIAHLAPWGYYALSSAAGYADEDLVALTPAYPSIAALGLVTAAVFLLLTHRFDRQEV